MAISKVDYLKFVSKNVDNYESIFRLRYEIFMKKYIYISIFNKSIYKFLFKNISYLKNIRRVYIFL